MRVSEKNSNLAHRWANEQITEAKGVNMLADQTTIYSYGLHFAIAKHVKNSKGEKAVLFTLSTYSNTTAKHIAIVRGAVSHLNVIYCGDPSDSHTKNIDGFLMRMKSDLKGLMNAKKPEKYINTAQIEFNYAKKYAEFFDIKLPSEFSDVMDNAANGKYKDYLIKEAERIEKEKKKKEAKKLRAHKRQVAEWRKFKKERLYSRNDNCDYLRYCETSKRVETSQGIEIPVAIAKKAFNWILSTIKTGGCLGECNYEILEYKVTEVNKDFIKIGCHNIQLKEINKLATSLGW